MDADTDAELISALVLFEGDAAFADSLDMIAENVSVRKMHFLWK